MGDGRKDHVALGTALNILDFDRGVKLAGSRSYVLRGLGTKLYQAVLRYALDAITSRNYEPFTVPILVTEQCMIGTGYFPAGKDQAYITQDNTVLVGTSEVPLASFHGDEILDEKDLPKRMCALSACFRREAGAAGKDTAGLYRVHQFDKVEQVVVHKADDAEHIALHEEIIANSEYILQQLKLPYRVVQNCTGDMGQGKWRMYDIETWMPSRNGYGETHSGSALRDFQARRLNLRYRPAGTKQALFCYTLNNTAIACPRILIAILENYQNADCSITVPEVLRTYMGGVEKIALKTAASLAGRFDPWGWLELCKRTCHDPHEFSAPLSKAACKLNRSVDEYHRMIEGGNYGRHFDRIDWWLLNPEKPRDSRGGSDDDRASARTLSFRKIMRL